MLVLVVLKARKEEHIIQSWRDQGMKKQILFIILKLLVYNQLRHIYNLGEAIGV